MIPSRLVRTRRAVMAGLLLAFTAAPLAARAADEPVVVFAAASLKNALDEAAAAWAKETGGTTRISYAGSNALAKQIEAGAPADLFISADLAWMDYAETNGTIRADSRVNLLRNAIVLVAAKGSGLRVTLEPGTDLSVPLAGGRLALGNVEAVPAGKYGRAALEKLGAWDRVKGQLAQTENVRAALLLVSRGEAPLGIVYATDAASDPGVEVVATFPADSHPPIVYPAALTKDSVRADRATSLLSFLRSPAARPFFERQGFVVVGAEKRS
ncbi:molybdate ABC transporter substrate-binding protein [Methylorubrum extorquens]|uniref:molybdate ABC transporter substrate-binding protein n=1 Tax=Methylorubrum extorquens TaxID=408 RepID=UPI0001590F40|nr:molybdate ABC transporter substrate-binding protein [Methylorubrum extorquens]ABY32845.1 molybdenum ABC transporter, periplasmic molybdate-binding protein [Methylorubrum extorquens PA1]KQP86089.1 molybdenum ABC transporter substrate-binding protein [Methylobacterium sp. Leaf119]WIU39433.1 molybdate ABC transporter substrate-binding protein [Methylorubrum extorquens]